MDYERIEKPFPTQGGGFSPKRLRAMLLGMERRRKGEEEEVVVVEQYEVAEPLPKAALRFDAEFDARRGSMCEECKDVDVVSSVSESSSSLGTGSGSHRSRDPHSAGSRVRLPEEDSCDSESVASNFEFHKERGSSARPVAAAVVPPFSKPAPSKWDDAQKWIASPTMNRPSRAGGAPLRKMEKTNFGGGRLPATKVVLEATEEVDTKRIDPSQDKREISWQKAANWAPPDPYPEVDSCAKAAFAADSTLADSAVTFSHHDSSTSLQSATTFISPPPTVRSVSMRDMGTEMTPIASQEPSRTGTPVRATSPNCSRPTTPRRTLGPNALGAVTNHGECSNAELSEKELQMKTRREIMLLGTQLGKTNIAAWASKQEEEKNASLSLKTVHVDQSTQNMTEIRAAAWEEAEKAKYLARFKREEIKIHAWEDHQKAKIQAEMRKIEVEVERMRARAQDRLMNQIASARHKAEEKRAAAEARRNRAAARTAEQADHIRRTGRVPSSLLHCWSWCS